MILFAESEQEKQLLDGLCRLLADIGIYAKGFEQDSVVAPVFWTVQDLEVFSYPSNHFSFSEKEDFLRSIEEPLHNAMTTAGYETILRELIQAGIVFSRVR